jgi:hypothetical protein
VPGVILAVPPALTKYVNNLREQRTSSGTGAGRRAMLQGPGIEISDAEFRGLTRECRYGTVHYGTDRADPGAAGETGV